MLPSPHVRIRHVIIPLGLSACQFTSPLDVPAWSHHEPGVGNGHQAETTITFESNFGDVEYLLEPAHLGGTVREGSSSRDRRAASRPGVGQGNPGGASR